MKVQPNASRSEVLGFQGDVLRVRVVASPREGKANQALVELLAKWLDVPKSSVTIVRGQASRDKVVEVWGYPIEKLSGVRPS